MICIVSIRLGIRQRWNHVRVLFRQVFPSKRRQKTLKATWIAFFWKAAALGVLTGCAIGVAGCAVSPAPIKQTKQVVATPHQGQLSVSVEAAPTVGDVQPVFISVANGTDSTRAVVPEQIFALDSTGSRVAPLPPGEAARQAGNANELKAVLASGAVSGVAGSAVGAGLGTAAGAALGSTVAGTVLGSVIGAGTAMFRGAERGQDRSDQQAQQQIDALSLKPQDAARNFTVSGYVFFPKGTYEQVEILLIDKETGDSQTIREPWR